MNDSRQDGIPKVLFIAATGRSGSTLVDTVLGQIEGFFSAGELLHLWDDGLTKRRLCGCGRSLPECPVWMNVLARLEERNSGPIDPTLLSRLQSDLLKLKNLPRLLSESRQSFWRDLDRHVKLFEDLYISIAETTGASVIIDSSKRPQQAAALLSGKRVNPYLLHLVRDPRGVARSMKKHVLMQPQSVSDPMAMKRSSTAQSALLWMKWNTAIELVSRRYSRSKRLRLRYEDFVANPFGIAAEVATWLHEPFRGLTRVSETCLEMAENHTVWGNPSRFSVGHVDLHEDRSWQSDLSPKERYISAVVTLPMLRHYGYKVSVPQRSSQRASTPIPPQR